MLGWPANGISARGVKMRTCAACARFVGGSTKVVSARLNSAAIACMRSVERPSALVTTASGLPPNCRSVNTSTVTKFNFIAVCSSRGAARRLLKGVRDQPQRDPKLGHSKQSKTQAKHASFIAEPGAVGDPDALIRQRAIEAAHGGIVI